MIMPTTKKVKEQPSEITIDRSEVTIIRHLPTCPKCKLTDDIFFFDVTSEIYECLRCNLRFRFAH
jgi:DNA-directed RNA polymerase subunit M/transcription elongation factor TFIIS